MVNEPEPYDGPLVGKVDGCGWWIEREVVKIMDIGHEPNVGSLVGMVDECE